MSNLDIFSGKDKAEIAIERLQTFCPEEGYYVAFSGGKDSCVIYDLCKKSLCKCDYHYNITGIDPPELYYFIRDNFLDVERHRPDVTIWKLIVKKMMPPTRRVRYCCEYLKERGGADRKVVTGVRWAESARRGKRRIVEACFKNDRKFYVNPIIDWSDEDVWEYIHKNKLKYCSLYDEGFKRLGCIGCPMAGKEGREKEFARWPAYEKKFRTAFAAAAAAARYLKNCSQEWADTHPLLQSWVDGEAMFNWWMKEQKHKDDPDQTVMFE